MPITPKHQVRLISRTDDLRLEESIAIQLRGAEVNPLSLDDRKGLVGWFGYLKLGEIIGIASNRVLQLRGLPSREPIPPIVSCEWCIIEFLLHPNKA